MFTPCHAYLNEKWLKSDVKGNRGSLLGIACLSFQIDDLNFEILSWIITLSFNLAVQLYEEKNTFNNKLAKGSTKLFF